MKKIVDNMSGGSDIEVERKMQNWVTGVQERAEVDKGKMRGMECGLRWAVEARRKGRREEQDQRRHDEQEQSGQQEAGQRRQEEHGQRRQGEQGQNSEQEPSKQVRFGQEEQLKEMRAESTDEPEVMGEHEGKGGGVGRIGTQQVENLVMDEIQENHREDVRKLVEMMQKEEEDQDGQRGRVAPNMEAGGSHPQAMSVPERKETQEMRWADCEDDEGKEEEEKEQEKEKETRQETEEEELTSEEPRLRAERTKRRKKEEERRAQEAREEERRAQEAQEEKRVQAAREEERRAQEAREEQERAQKALEEGRAQGERREEREVEAQERHDGEEEMTTQEKCVEAKKEANSMHEENDVSNRHMTWWRDAWWVRMDNGAHLRTARGRRKVWRAATRAAREARETERIAGGEREKWEQGTKGRRENNTLHVVFHFPTTTATPTGAAATAAATAAVRLQ